MATKDMELMKEEDGGIVLRRDVMTGASQEEIQRRIYTVRGVQVMLDRDLAIMFQVDTKVLIQTVKRNIRRFPERFMFQLTDVEWTDWKSQFVTTKCLSFEEIQSIKMGVRRPPFVFAEQGVSQLSSVLKSDVAIGMSIRIIDAFVLVEELIQKAVMRIVLIDDYVNAGVLQWFHKRKSGVTLDCYVKSRFATQDLMDAIEQYNSQYPGEPTELHAFERSHDRWLIIDDTVYHFGASIKDLGKKWFAVDVITEQTADELIARL